MRKLSSTGTAGWFAWLLLMSGCFTGGGGGEAAAGGAGTVTDGSGTDGATTAGTGLGGLGGIAEFGDGPVYVDDAGGGASDAADLTASSASPARSCAQPGGLLELSVTSVDGACAGLPDPIAVDLSSADGFQAFQINTAETVLTVKVERGGCTLQVSVTEGSNDNRGLLFFALDRTPVELGAPGEPLEGTGSGQRTDESGALMCRGSFLVALRPQEQADDSADGPAMAGGFSEQHERDILDDCSNTVACQLQRGELPAGEDELVEGCVEMTAVVLDQFTPEDQARYLAKRERCEDLIACDYLSCVAAD